MSSALLLGWPLSAAAHTGDSRTGSSTSIWAIADGAIGIWSNGTTMWEADRSGDGLDAGAPAGVTRAEKKKGGVTANIDAITRPPLRLFTEATPSPSPRAACR